MSNPDAPNATDKRIRELFERLNVQPLKDIPAIELTSKSSTIAKKENTAFINKDYDAETEGKKIEHDDLRNTIKLRRRIGYGVFALCLMWLIIIAYTVLCAGAGRLIFADKVPISLDAKTFYLEPSVLISLISGSIVNVLALLLIVIKFLFNHSDKIKFLAPANLHKKQ